ncbi:efflux RND transporter periplasmic adaptor subunit [Tunturibacter psychrotolerans]|uniref:Efflux RND transporter periplasmic adaptor subunit n=1 Tax=Tunturiibacter psychrotolerans TaxID=3069686 RepID=A0AAU7ZLE9_9BACT
MTTILLGAFSFLITGCKKAEESTAPEVTVKAVHPQIGSISEQITADATLAPFAQATLSPKVTAPVRKFYVQRGSIVKAGQLLATLENRDLEAAALDNKGVYTSAQAAYETATRATAPEDYTKAQLDLTQAKGMLDLNQSIVSARSQLFAQGAIPGRDLDTAKATLVQSQAAYDIAKQHFETIQKVSHKATLENAQGQLASAQGKYLGAQAQLSYTEMRSPISGVVTDRPLFEGETAAAGTPVITIMDTSALLAKLHISQMQSQQLTQGALAEVTIPGVSDPVAAKVSLISPALDPGSTTVEVWIRVENPKNLFKAGTAAHAVITGRTVSKALLIPSEAVQTAADGTTKSVMVIVADGSARKHTVVLGIQTPETVQVLSGITTADTVITTGAYGLDDGTKVKIGADAADKLDSTGADTKPGPGKKDD